MNYKPVKTSWSNNEHVTVFVCQSNLYNVSYHWRLLSTLHSDSYIIGVRDGKPNDGMPNGENDILQAKCRTSLGAMTNGPNAEN